MFLVRQVSLSPGRERQGATCCSNDLGDRLIKELQIRCTTEQILSINFDWPLLQEVFFAGNLKKTSGLLSIQAVYFVFRFTPMCCKKNTRQDEARRVHQNKTKNQL